MASDAAALAYSHYQATCRHDEGADNRPGITQYAAGSIDGA